MSAIYNIYNKKNYFIRLFFIALAMAIILSVSGMAAAAGRTYLSRKTFSLKTGKTAVLKLKNNKKKTSWKIVSGKKRIKITVLAKNRIKVKGISSGNAVVQVKAGKNKYRCKITVKASNDGKRAASPSPSPNISPSPSPVSIPGPSLSGLIGKSVDSLKQEMGAPVRIDSAPQEFDSYIYNPNGDYSAYMIVGVKDNAVVYCFTISKGFTYGSYIKEGDSKSTLISNGWKADGSFCGLTHQYKLESKSETAYAYYDRLGSGQVYGIMIFSNNFYSPYAFFYDGSNEYTSDMISDTAVEMRELTNAFRVYNGLAPLKENSNGDTAARLHSQDMADNKYIDHTGKDGRAPADRLRDAGVSFSIAGENIAHGCADAVHLVNAWINSRAHRDNIMNKNYEYIGCGTGYKPSSVFDPDYTVNGNFYGTQVFWK